MFFDPMKYDVEWITFGDETHPKEWAVAIWEIHDTSLGEETPHNEPDEQGNSVDINIYVDTDHSGNRITMQSHTCIIIFLNMAPIVWCSKKQNTIEPSTFTAELTALKTAVEIS